MDTKLLLVLGTKSVTPDTINHLKILKSIMSDYKVQVVLTCNTDMSTAIKEYSHNNDLIYLTGDFSGDEITELLDSVPTHLDINGFFSTTCCELALLQSLPKDKKSYSTDGSVGYNLKVLMDESHKSTTMDKADIIITTHPEIRSSIKDDAVIIHVGHDESSSRFYHKVSTILANRIKEVMNK